MRANHGVKIRPLEPRKLAFMYLSIKERLIEAGFADEIDWQEEVSFEQFDEPTFLREAAWVVLSSGFRETVLRRRFGEISRAFLHWSSADTIIAKRETCRSNALAAFGNQRKINAILKIVERVSDVGIHTIRDEIGNRGTQYLQELPFIGPITSCHLAKNIGIAMVKPDRHLTRLAMNIGYKSVDQMCQVISNLVGDSLPVIDIVMWRYATITAQEEKKNAGLDLTMPLFVNHSSKLNYANS